MTPRGWGVRDSPSRAGIRGTGELGTLGGQRPLGDTPGVGGYVTHPRSQVSVGTGEFGTLGGQCPLGNTPGVGGWGVRNSPSRAGIRGDLRTRDPGRQGPLGDTPGVGGT